MRTCRPILLIAATAVALGWMPVPLSAEDGSNQGMPPISLMPLTARRMTYRLKVDGQAERAGATLKPHESREDSWWLRVGSHRHSLLRATDDGGIEVVRQKLPDAGMTLRYDPAYPLLPERCKPGASVRTTGDVRIETDDGDVHEGQIVHRVRVVGRVQTATPRGKVEALRVRTVDKVDLGLVDIRIEAETHYVPGRGRAYQRMTTTRRTIEFFSETTKESFRVRRWRKGPARE